MVLKSPIRDMKYDEYIAFAFSALRLYSEIRKTQPKMPIAGICLQGDTTLRLLATLQLYHDGKIAPIIVSGGVIIEENEDKIRLDEKPAKEMKKFLLERGVPNKAIILEESSLTTHAHPSNVYSIMERLGLTDLLIITSGYHLLRAYLRFLYVLKDEKLSFSLYGHPAGTVFSWLQKIPGKNLRLMNFLTDELRKIKEYEGLASFDDASEYIQELQNRY